MHCVTLHVQTCNHSCVSGCARHPKGRPLSCHADTQQVLWVEHTSGLLSLWQFYMQDKIERLTLHYFFFLMLSSVTRRCFPALGEKGGVITVGNNSHFDDGSGKMRDAKDLVDGVKWVCVCVCVYFTPQSSDTNTRHAANGVGVSPQKRDGGHWSSSGRHEDLWRLHAVLVLDPHVSFSRQQFFLHACLLETWHAVF